MRIILGIDPGSRVTGWGIIKSSSAGNELVKCGTLKLKADSLNERLLELYMGLDQLFSLYQPNEISLEKIFLGKNVDSAFKLGHARGVCLMCVAKHKTEVFEYAARKVKQSLTGSGAASKEQVQTLTQAELNIKNKLPLDASDALALAICHSIHRKAVSKLQVMKRGVEL